MNIFLGKKPENTKLKPYGVVADCCTQTETRFEIGVTGAKQVVEIVAYFLNEQYNLHYEFCCGLDNKNDIVFEVSYWVEDSNKSIQYKTDRITIGIWGIGITLDEIQWYNKNDLANILSFIDGQMKLLIEKNEKTLKESNQQLLIFEEGERLSKKAREEKINPYLAWLEQRGWALDFI